MFSFHKVNVLASSSLQPVWSYSLVKRDRTLLVETAHSMEASSENGSGIISESITEHKVLKLRSLKKKLSITLGTLTGPMREQQSRRGAF